MKVRMSYMEKLLDGVEVEWKPLGEVFHLKNGYTPSKANEEYWRDGTVPWFRMEDIRDNGRVLHDSIQRVSKNAIKGGKLFPRNSIIIATSATIGEHALITVPYLSNQRFTNLSLKDNYKDHFDIKFLFYYAFILDEWCRNNTTMSSFAAVDMIGFRKIPIPIPPLHIQAKIVQILDTFTALTAELTAELTARRKQYNYYRETLLQFGPDVEWKTLGEIGTFTYGYTAKGQEDGDARFIRITDISSNGKLISGNEKYTNIIEKNKKYLLRKNDILMARTGATYGKTMLFEESYDAIYAGFLIKLSFDGKIISPKYYWHFSQSGSFRAQADKLVSGGGQPQFNANVLKDVVIPIPPLSEQERIVSILDKFDALTHSITEGLPREIELRRKQYEYYRDMLLSFPKPE